MKMFGVLHITTCALYSYREQHRRSGVRGNHVQTRRSLPSLIVGIPLVSVLPGCAGHHPRPDSQPGNDCQECKILRLTSQVALRDPHNTTWYVQFEGVVNRYVDLSHLCRTQRGLVVTEFK